MMKQIIFFLLISVNIYQVKTQGLEAYLDYGTFFVPNGKPYVEAYLSITGRSINWKNVQGNPFSNIEVTLILWKDTSIVNFSKEIIKENGINDSISKTINIIYEQRLEAEKGKYRLQLRLIDKNDSLKPMYSGTEIDIDFPNDSTSISSIMNVKSYSKTTTASKITKSGVDIIPRISNFYRTKDSIFTFYAEIYPKKNLKLDEQYLIVFYLKNHENNNALPKFKKFKKISASEVNILLSSFNISGLASGNYDFIIDVIDKNNKQLASQSYFIQRENLNLKIPFEDIQALSISSTFVENIANADTLKLIIESMRPITSSVEVEFANKIIKQGDELIMRQYLLHFWEQRNIDNPELPFSEYIKEVQKVEKSYSTMIRHGFETDRGRVYLQYGPPNTISENYHEPSAYPYEIWHYYTLNSQRNRKFIFYNSELASKEFYLLHSDAIGEVNDYQWRLHLRARDEKFKSIDDTGENANDWGSKYNEWYELPH